MVYPSHTLTGKHREIEAHAQIETFTHIIAEMIPSFRHFNLL